MATKKEKTTILYERLSREDLLRGQSDSNSIANQKMILENYAKSQGFGNIRHISDDGVSGSLFTRPGLDVLIEEVKSGNVAVVIIKDSSRLGRDVIEVGLLKRLFEDNEVRLIAAEEGLDSAKGFDIMSVMRDVINEYYLADCSRKIRTVKRNCALQGKSQGKVVYGYYVDEQDSTVLHIDEEVVENIREAYRRVIGGEGPAAIARDFNARGILSPAAYRIFRKNENSEGVDTRWFTWSVQTLLKNQAYIGRYIASRYTSPSYKNRKRIERPEDEWIIIEDHHPAIIDVETFTIVQQLSESRPKPQKNKHPRVAINGLVRCGDCGGNMRQQNNGRRLYGYFICQTYSDGKNKGDTHCTRHSIRCDVLEDIVLAKIQETIADARTNKKKFAQRIQKSSNKQGEKLLKAKTAELAKAERRIAELDKIISKICEDQIGGALSEMRFKKLLAGYETEQETLSVSAVMLVAEIEGIKAKTASVKSFIQLAEKFSEITELTSVIARTFIQKVVVYEAVRTDDFLKKTISQKIEIYFNHIGEYVPD